MRDALPFRVKDVFVITAEEDGQYPAQGHHSDLLACLESHAIFAERVHVPRDGDSIGACLLERTAGLRAEWLVMGAYGRGHIGRLCWAGTRFVLRHSHTPLLLSH